MHISPVKITKKTQRDTDTLISVIPVTSILFKVHGSADV